jgi:hypothetical protein
VIQHHLVLVHPADNVEHNVALGLEDDDMVVIEYDVGGGLDGFLE